MEPGTHGCKRKTPFSGEGESNPPFFSFHRLSSSFLWFLDSNLLSSLLFLSIHLPGWIMLHALTLSNVLSIFVLGVIFAIIFYYSQTLWSSIIAHSLNDFLSSVLFHIS
jgi:uncharacterized protein